MDFSVNLGVLRASVVSAATQNRRRRP